MVNNKKHVLTNCVLLFLVVNNYDFSGVHTRNKDKIDCSTAKLVDGLKEEISENKNYFFPAELMFVKNHDRFFKLAESHGYGGWSNPRDIQLCISFLS